MLGTIQRVGAAMIFSAMAISPLQATDALVQTPAGACWQAHAFCNEAAFGDETWRSACYADLTGCLRDTRPARCLPEATPYCEAFKAECQGFIEEGSPTTAAQCAADHDSCLMSFGC